MSVHFTQCCPTCGRRIRIRASLLGRTVACQHCRCEFEAQMESDRGIAHGPVTSDETDPLMARVEALLAQSASDSSIR
ncbi:MAG: response regulator [Planctomycetota bacterium]